MGAGGLSRLKDSDAIEIFCDCVLGFGGKTRTQMVETGVCVLVGVTGVDVWAERLGKNGVFCAILTQLAVTKLGQVMCFPQNQTHSQPENLGQISPFPQI